MTSLIAIFGGTFDPPHHGHLALAAAAQVEFDLTRLLWVLTPNPPHKPGQPITPLAHRLAMVKLALADAPGCELSTIEIDRPAPYYALDTVRLLSEMHPGAGLVYLMGGDSLRDLPAWHRPADLLAALHAIGVMRRPGDSVDLPALEAVLPGIGAKVRFIDTALTDISASEIRRRVAEGLPYRDTLPLTVYDYIQENQLYCTH